MLELFPRRDRERAAAGGERAGVLKRTPEYAPALPRRAEERRSIAGTAAGDKVAGVTGGLLGHPESDSSWRKKPKATSGDPLAKKLGRRKLYRKIGAKLGGDSKGHSEGRAGRRSGWSRGRAQGAGWLGRGPGAGRSPSAPPGQ